jgi:hypothetical protein
MRGDTITVVHAVSNRWWYVVWEPLTTRNRSAWMTIYFFYDTAYMVTNNFKIYMVTTKNYYHYASEGPQAVGSSLEQYLTIMGAAYAQVKADPSILQCRPKLPRIDQRARRSLSWPSRCPEYGSHTWCSLIWFGRTFRTVVSPRVRLWSTPTSINPALRSSSSDCIEMDTTLVAHMPIPGCGYCNLAFAGTALLLAGRSVLGQQLQR